MAPAPIPEGAPRSFVEAFEEARAAKCPFMLVFGAEWCSACQRLKEETLRHPDVAGLLSGVKVFECDLDKSLELGHWYGVTAVPHVVFIDRDGLIVNEVRDFEPPDAFLSRLETLIRG